MIPAVPFGAFIGPVLRERRLELGLTQEEVAVRAGTCCRGTDAARDPWARLRALRAR